MINPGLAKRPGWGWGWGQTSGSVTVLAVPSAGIFYIINHIMFVKNAKAFLNFSANNAPILLFFNNPYNILTRSVI